MDGERRTMGEQRRLRVTVQGGERVPKVFFAGWEAPFPGFVSGLNRLRRRAFLQSRCLGGEGRRVDGNLQTAG
jgi:hypothetical protein